MNSRPNLVIGNSHQGMSARSVRRVHLDRDAQDWEVDFDLARIAERYEGALRRAGLVDFDDLVIYGNQLVANHDWVLSAIAARWPALAVDEYQDLGLPLH